MGNPRTASVRSIAQPLIDSVALSEIAKEIGVPIDVAKKLCAALGELPVEQMHRIVGVASRDELKRLERDRRRQTERRRRSS